MNNLTLKCTNCNGIKPVNNFAKNTNNGKEQQEHDYWCTDCRKKMVVDEQSLIEYCRENNRGYSQELFKQTLKMSEDKLKKKNKVEKINNYDELLIKNAINLYFSKMNLIGNEGRKIIDKKNNNIKVSKDLISNWGEGFEDFEYQQLQNYYNDLLGYYEIENPVHKNLIKLGAMNAVLAEKALRENRTADYAKLQSAYSSILSDSRLKPSQKNAADGSGLATVGQWVEKLEMIDGKIPQHEIVDPDKIDKAIEYFISKMKENLNISGGV
jgi:ribosomal protein L37AE/L43A